jgi:hypothetical protein
MKMERKKVEEGRKEKRMYRTKRTIHKRWQLIRGLKNVDNEEGKGRGKEGREEGRKEGRGERE